MTKILLVSKRQASKHDKTIIHEAIYDSGRIRVFYGENITPKTVLRFVEEASNISNIWNSSNRIRETIYKA